MNRPCLVGEQVDWTRDSRLGRPWHEGAISHAPDPHPALSLRERESDDPHHANPLPGGEGTGAPSPCPLPGGRGSRSTLTQPFPWGRGNRIALTPVSSTGQALALSLVKGEGADGRAGDCARPARRAAGSRPGALGAAVPRYAPTPGALVAPGVGSGRGALGERYITSMSFMELISSSGVPRRRARHRRHRPGTRSAASRRGSGPRARAMDQRPARGAVGDSRRGRGPIAGGRRRPRLAGSESARRASLPCRGRRPLSGIRTTRSRHPHWRRNARPRPVPPRTR